MFFALISSVFQQGYLDFVKYQGLGNDFLLVILVQIIPVLLFLHEKTFEKTKILQSEREI